MSKILLADNLSERRSILSNQLTTKGFSVNAVSQGTQALKLLLTNQPDLALIASDLPRLNANQICLQLRTAGNLTPVVQFLPHNRHEARVSALQAGADYALACPIAMDELLASIHALLRRSRRQAHLPSAPTMERSELELCHRDLVVHLSQPSAQRNGQDLRLTAKEHELLLHLIRNRGQVCKRSQILADVWGRSWQATDNLLDVYIGYLRKKLDLPGTQAMLRTVRGVGFILD